ncbi:hypothetical protein [Mammaliicoccus vitulinus]|uniref:hypothetical protein n=1 Tax=Mammaliicoccus vitulinus TaxID=71237 RepID=UPI003F9D6CE1
MVRQIYYLRRERYKNARSCVDDLFEKHHCILKPGNLIAYERSNRNLDDITLKALAKLLNATVETIESEDGHDWRDLRKDYKA